MKSTLLTTLVLALSFTLFSQVKDIDGNEYETVKIGEQEWMAENLNASHFRNGDEIMQAKTEEEWKKAGEAGMPAWCYYNFDENNGLLYGKLYNYYAFSDSRELAPENFRLPKNSDLMYVNFIANGNSRNLITGDWINIKESNNELGFSALPCGYIGFTGFTGIGEETVFWTLEEQNDEAPTKNAGAQSISSVHNFFAGDFWDKFHGFSVRCIKSN